MNLPDFRRLIRPITNKIFLLLGRAVLKAVDESGNAQRIQVLALKNETISDIERFQEYGFESYPLAEAEVFIGFLNGNRDHGIAICVHDERHRPQDLSEGESAMYTDEDQKSGGHRIHLKRNQIIQIDCKNAIINCSEDVEINSVNATVNCSGDIETNAVNTTINSSGNIETNSVDATVNCSGKCNIVAGSGVDIDGGAGNLGGVVTAQSACPLIGKNHIDFSSDVKGSK